MSSGLTPAVAGLERVGSREADEIIASAAPSNRLRLFGGPVLPLPDHVREAAIAALAGPDRRPARGLPELRKAIAERFVLETGRPIDAERELVLTNGAMQGLSTVFRALLAQGDEVVVPTPTFFFDGALKLAGGVPVYVACREEDGWAWDIARIEAAVTNRTRMLLICNPTNPTGYLPTREDFRRLMAIAEKHDLVIVSDESFHYATYEQATVPLAGIAGDPRRLVTVRSLSKSHALANWRLGYVHAAPEIVDGVARIIEWECLHLGYVQQIVALAAITGPQDWLAGISDQYRAIRDRLIGAIAGSEWISCVKPAAGPFLFPNFERAEAKTGTEAFEQLLALGIPTVPGRYFHGPGHVRLSFGGDAATVAALADRLRQFSPGRRAA
jgi:aminotransferase